MLRPTKFTDINISILALGSEIVRALKKSGIMTYDELFSRIIALKGIKSKENFLPALDFLFLLGKLAYHKQDDVIELIKYENK